jgi:hypothetical protein
MTELFKFILLFIALELLLGFFYYRITPKSIRASELDHKSLLKGIVERFFLMVSLINNFPHALTLFGTLKLATRLKRESDNEKINESTFNDFYLIGNFISVIMAIFYAFLYSKYMQYAFS